MTSFAVAQVDITPPPGLAMAGFPDIRAVPGAPTSQIPGTGYVARQGVATGTLDPLLATVLLAQDDGVGIAIVALDLLVVTTAFSRDLRTRIADATGISPDAILVHASHTHAGPEPFGVWADPRPDYLDEIADRITHLAAHAHGKLTPATIYAGRCVVGHLLANRRVPPGPIDPWMDVLRIERDDGDPLAIVVRVAGHPLVLPPENLRYSADWPGSLRDALAERHGAGVPVLFLNGTAGNINPVGYPLEAKEDIIAQHRRYRRQGVPPIRDEAHLRRIGEGMADASDELLDRIGPGGDEERRRRARMVTTPLRFARREVTFPMKTGEALERYCEYLAVNEATTARLRTLDGFPSEVQALRLGDLDVIGLPGEPFIETGLAIAERSSARTCLVLGYCNDDPRYIPIEAAFDGNAYDTFGTPLSSGAETALLDATTTLLEDLT